MKQLLENIGYIIDNAPNERIAGQARALLADCANPHGMNAILANYIRLVCRFLEAMDAGAKYDEFEYVADISADWLKFDPKYTVKQGESLKFDYSVTNPDFFPLFAHAVEEAERPNLDGLEQLGYWG